MDTDQPRNRPHLETKIIVLRWMIVAQADMGGADGWLQIPLATAEGGFLAVPRGAFEHWATGGIEAPGIVPWTSLSPSGLKQEADDPFHTDWMLGAGLAPNAMADDPVLSDAVWQARAAVEHRLLRRTASLLLPGPDHVMGIAVHPTAPDDFDCLVSDIDPAAAPILILPDLRPDWLDLVMTVFDHGGGVIAARGGAMAHLVVAARGHGGPILRVDRAVSLYPAGTRLAVHGWSASVTLEAEPDPARFDQPWTAAGGNAPVTAGVHLDQTGEDAAIPIAPGFG